MFFLPLFCLSLPPFVYTYNGKANDLQGIQLQ